MKIGTKARYAVMAMIDMARYGNQGSPVSLSDIARRQELSLSYLEQLFCKLRRAGLVSSVRGALGGYCLARSIEKISIAEITEAAEEPWRFTRCDSSKTEGCMADRTQCLTHHLWEALETQVFSYLSGISLKDVLEKEVFSGSHDLNFKKCG